MIGDIDYREHIHLILIALTAVSTWRGFNNLHFHDRMIFSVGAILGKSKQWDRLITSAFLHGDFMHLLFNMVTLYFFSPIIIHYFGVWQYLTIYFASVIGGGLLSLFLNRKNYYYRALGASGGVVGILFAAIAIMPTVPIYIMFIPIGIPGFIYGVIYLGYSIYGMRKGGGNIGHDAHLGGAAIGLALALVLDWSLIYTNGIFIGIMIIPLLILAGYVFKNR